METAAEIAGAMPSKQVTLVNSGPDLLAGQPPKLMARALKSLQKQGVQVRLCCPWARPAGSILLLGQQERWQRDEALVLHHEGLLVEADHIAWPGLACRSLSHSLRSIALTCFWMLCAAICIRYRLLGSCASGIGRPPTPPPLSPSPIPSLATLARISCRMQR